MTPMPSRLARAAAVVWRRSVGAGQARPSLLLGTLLLASALAFVRRTAEEPATTLRAVKGAGAPLRSTAHGYVTSDACRSCHAREYATWHASYHRSMTELPSAASMRAPWQGVTLQWQDRTYVLTERAGEFWVKLPDPDRVAAALARGETRTPGPEVAPDVERRVVLTTGSHHYQAYWVPGARGNELWQMPFVYHFEAQRFLPRHEVFLQPPEDPPHAARWNSNCIQCHSVGGEPQHDLASDRFATRVAELGIACEACHGPGAEHVRVQQDPLAVQPTPGAGSIFNPARSSAARASEVCGQCHSYFVPREPERWWQSGFAGRFRPGDALEQTRQVLDYERDRASADDLLSVGLDSLFYTDGTIRVGGREWNGLARSACFARGTGDRQASCLSCHRMHGGTRDDQLATTGESSAACATCHPGVASAGSEHTHHAPLSSGNECLNCHMPHTTYALFKAIRSHRITRPLVDPRRGAAPNACNLCHLDQSLAWTAKWLSRWYGVADPFREPSRSAEPKTAPLAEPPAPHELALATGVLDGNAALRVILADRLAWDAAREASGSGWQAQLLTLALEDPYAAVRFVARRSLSKLAARAAPRRAAQSPPAPPFTADYTLDQQALERLRAARDDTPVRIAE
jgi:predicted CXXCH cytochrome family protein